MKTETIQIRISEDWLRALDAWRDAQPVPPSRSDVIRIAVDRFITDKVYKEIKEAGAGE